MNVRLRQIEKAHLRYCKYDPCMMATLRNRETCWSEVLVFHRSELPKMREQYGEDLELLFEDDEDA